MELLEKMNYNLKTRNRRKESMFPEIQADLVKILLKQDDLTKDMISDFEANMVTNPEVFNDKEMYKGLSNSRDLYYELDRVKDSIEEEQVINMTR